MSLSNKPLARVGWSGASARGFFKKLTMNQSETRRYEQIIQIYQERREYDMLLLFGTFNKSSVEEQQ